MDTRRTLIIATRNKGKINEIKQGLSDICFEIKSLNDIKLDMEVEETGKSFKENAIIKAKVIGERTGLLTLADDSGLEVDALGGRPGIFSSRYADGTDLDRINKLLRELKGIAKEKRGARFKAVVALYIPASVMPNDREGSLGLSELASARDSSISPSTGGFARNDNSYRIVTFEGVSEGYITENPIGTNGFGYDPIFFNLDLGKTNAQVTLSEKNRVSHRAKALFKAKEFFLYTYK